MTGGRWEAVTQAAKDLISCLLVVDPNSRLSSRDILQHEGLLRDRLVVNCARKVMGLGMIEERDGESESGTLLGSDYANAVGDAHVGSVKRKRDVSKSIGARKRRCFIS